MQPPFLPHGLPLWPPLTARPWLRLGLGLGLLLLYAIAAIHQFNKQACTWEISRQYWYFSDNANSRAYDTCIRNELARWKGTSSISVHFLCIRSTPHSYQGVVFFGLKYWKMKFHIISRRLKDLGVQLPLVFPNCSGLFPFSVLFVYS